MQKPGDTKEPARILSFYFWLAVGLALFAVLSGNVRAWDMLGPTIFPAARPVLIPALLVCAGCLLLARFRLSRLAIRPEPFVGVLAFLFFSDWLCRSNGMLQGPAIRGEIIFGALIILGVLWRLRSSPAAESDAAPGKAILRGLLFLLPWAAAAFLFGSSSVLQGGE